MSLADYNAYVWAKTISEWFRQENVSPGCIVDICAGSGLFVSELVNAFPSASGTAVDMVPPNRAHRVKTYTADLKQSGSLDDLGGCDLVCFMNSLYVIGRSEEVVRYICNSGAQDLVLTVPLEKAIAAFEQQHPGKNIYSPTVDEFIGDLGFKRHRAARVCGAHYLINPRTVLVGSINGTLASIVERVYRRGHYELIWAKRLQ